jgi:hypothetical protein
MLLLQAVQCLSHPSRRNVTFHGDSVQSMLYNEVSELIDIRKETEAARKVRINKDLSVGKEVSERVVSCCVMLSITAMCGRR